MKGFVIFILSLVVLVFIGSIVIVKIKRQKLLEAWVDFAKGQGVKLPEAQMKTGFDKLDNNQLNVLINFSQALKDKKFLIAAGMFKDVKPVLQVAKLDSLQPFLDSIKNQIING